MVGCDSCTLGPKYSFTVPSGTGIVWYRKTEDDEGWLTVGLPYAVEKVTWESPDGETVASERLCFEKITGEGVVFHRMETDEAWKACVPYLWKATESRESVVCFYGDGTVVQAQENSLKETDGFIQYSAGMILKMRRKVFFFWMIAAHGLCVLRREVGWHPVGGIWCTLELVLIPCV